MSAQHHVRMLVDDEKRIGLVVLAVDGEQDAAVIELEQLPLEIAIAIAGIRMTQRNAANAILADDATPQRIVEIEHDALLGDSLARADRTREIIDDEWIGRLLVGVPRDVPHFRVVQTLMPVYANESIEVPHEGRRLLG